MIFLGPLFRREEESIIKSMHKGPLSGAANAWQWELIEGLNQCLSEPVSIYNVMSVGTYPRHYKKLLLKTRKWSYQGSNNIEIGSVNLPVIKQLQRTLKTKRLLRKSKDKHVMIYSTYYPFLKAIRKLDRSYHVTLIVPDLPQFLTFSKISKFECFIRKYMNRSMYKCMDRVDNFVLLTEAMKNPLNVGERPYVIVEGMKNLQAFPEIKENPNHEKIIFYAGQLQMMFGIGRLLDAFAMIDDPDYRLWLCGSGDAENEIRKRAETDPRIQFFGYVTKKRADGLQAQATVLVNPRTAEGEYTQYSFPSKTIEYMSTGVPVVMYKLPGIPEEYDEFLNYVDNESVESLRDTIVKICEMSESARREIGMRAFNFILKEKNSQKQAKKIINMMENKKK